MKNFLFYVGNGRAGSTWLHGALNGRGDCDFGPVKEYFMFTDYNPHEGFDKKDYFDIFSFRAENSQIKLLGDVSPANALASAEELSRYKEEMTARNFNILPVMTLRDPINQILSWTRMQCKVRGWDRSTDRWYDRSWDRTIDANLIMEIGLPPFRPVSWRETVNNVLKTFDKIHYNVYETLFCDESMSKLEDYLQIPHETYDYNKIVFSFGKPNQISEVDKQFLFDNYPNYKDDYQFAVETFGKDFIESIWWTPNK
jgi:hypothetical protein